MTPIQVLLAKAAVVVLLLAVAFGAGWRTKAAFVAEAELARQETKSEFINTFRAMEGEVAKTVEDKLAGLKANERVIEHEKIQLVDRPVYSNVCLDADGVQLVERARTGSGKADPGKPADKVPPAK